MKSTDFEQIQNQQSAIRELRFAWTDENRKMLYTVNCTGMPQFIFAIESECAKDTLAEWFAKEPHLCAVCVIDKFILRRDPVTLEVECINANNEQIEILHFIEFLHSTIRRSDRELRSQTYNPGDPIFGPDLGAYLTFDVPFPPTREKLS
ncbi:MAG TPA: hypothetical protein VFE62_03455 [Gemmataceae bacterium]|nr:hypothetical protein [Gemmataceae bacterium]